MGLHNKWRAHEEDLLREKLGIWPLPRLCRALGRTETAIRIKAKRLKLNQRDNYWTSRMIAAEFRVDSHKVVDQWIASGLLKARRAPVTYGPYRPWSVDPAELERFIRQHPEHYDWRRMEPGPYRNMARAAWERDPVLNATEAARELGVNRATVHRHLRKGWLQGVRVREAGKYGGWRIRRSALASFCPRKPDSVGNTYLKDSGRAVWAA